ncbi:MAG TPA: hypothetical protein VMK65_01190, partial [Longimicrobiales bacterium]|nr:hypothetical protein [Longimicrobiales bacterium]
MSAPPLRTVEDTRVFTTLGIRFWDAAFDVPIHVPLVVHAWLPEGPVPPVRAVRSPSGVYSFHALPGRAAAEYPGGEEHPEDLGPELDYVIVVDDPGGRFLPAAFTLALPLGFRGVFPDDAIASEPGGAPPRAYLFPSPAYPVPPGAAAIRVDLLDADTDPDEPEPAAWAVVRATLEGRELTGIADESGRVLLLAALPLVERLNLGSPPGSGVEPAPGGGPGGGGPGGGPGGGGPG